jgi:predicted permease
VSVFSKFLALFRRRRADAEMSAELQAHLDALAERHIAAGLSPEDARYAALREFGGVEQVKERCRDERRWIWFDQAAQDLRYAARGLRRNPTYSMVVIATLAIGIGAATALLSVAYGVLLHPFPYADAAGIWTPYAADVQTLRRDTHAFFDEYQQLRTLPAVSDTIATVIDEDEAVTTNPAAVQQDFDGVLVSANAFEFLGVPALLGRTLGPADVLPTGDARPVVVLSYRFWQRMYGGMPNIVGQTLYVRGEPQTVVGVMPPRFAWGTDSAFWRPLPANKSGLVVQPSVRLKPGTSVDVAAQQLAALHDAWARIRPREFPPHGFVSGFGRLIDLTPSSARLRVSLRLLAFAVAFLLLIACTNVANLQFARAVGRAREFAMRLALGATRGRIVRQLLGENLLLSVLGAGLGLLVAMPLMQVVMALVPPDYVPREAHVALNAPVLLFTTMLSTIAAMAFGFSPAWQCSRADAGNVLKPSGATDRGHRSNAVRHGLIGAQIALSLVLLTGAALTIRGFIDLERRDPGFEPGHLLRVRLPKDPRHFSNLASSLEFDTRVVAAVRNLPGVESATIGNLAFAAPGGTTRFALAGQRTPADERMLFGLVDQDYLRTMRIPLRRGRNISADDVAAGRAVCLVNEAAAKRWPGIEPLGRPIALTRLAEPGRSEDFARDGLAHRATIIGIIGDVQPSGVLDPAAPAIFVPYTLRAPTWRMLAIRTRGDEAAILSAVATEIQRIDPQVPIDEPSSGDQMVTRHMAAPRFSLTLFVSLATIALLLALGGVYGLAAYLGSQRTREFGIRTALGARRDQLVALVIGRTAGPVVFGIGLGVLGSVALSGFVTSTVFIRPHLDVATVSAAMLLLCLAAFLASLVPALRASQADPMIALRAE